MKHTFTVPFSKLRAACLFVSSDETRELITRVHVEHVPGGVVLVATDGRRMAAILHDSLTDLFPAFDISPDLIRMADGGRLEQAFNELADIVAFDADWRLPTNRDCLITLDTERKSVTLRPCLAADFPGDHEFTGPARIDDPSRGWGNSNYPEWRKSLAMASGDLHPAATVTLSGVLLGAFTRAGELLGQYGAMAIHGVAPATDEGGASIYRVEIGVPEFVGILMPVRYPEWAKSKPLPSWVLSPASSEVRS